MMKTISTTPASISPVVPGMSAGVADPVPPESSPSPPAGYVPTKAKRGFRPRRAQVSIAPKVASELRASTRYAAQFGPAVPDAASIADALTVASAWSAKLESATAWQGYVKQQEELAWKHALSLTDPLRVPFDYNVARDKTLAEEMPSVEAFFGAPKEATKKGNATKKRKAAAAAAKD